MPTRRTQKQRRQSRKNRQRKRGGAQDYELNVRNCQRYYHPTNPSFCTTPSPGGDTPAKAIDYPGIARQMQGEKPRGKYGRSAGKIITSGY